MNAILLNLGVLLADLSVLFISYQFYLFLKKYHDLLSRVLDIDIRLFNLEMKQYPAPPRGEIPRSFFQEKGAIDAERKHQGSEEQS